MDSHEILGMIAGISVALAGFGGIVAGIGRRASSEWTSDDRTRLQGIARISIVIVFACLLPGLVAHFRAAF